MSRGPKQAPVVSPEELGEARSQAKVDAERPCRPLRTIALPDVPTKACPPGGTLCSGCGLPLPEAHTVGDERHGADGGVLTWLPVGYPGSKGRRWAHWGTCPHTT